MKIKLLNEWTQTFLIYIKGNIKAKTITYFLCTTIMLTFIARTLTAVSIIEVEYVRPTASFIRLEYSTDAIILTDSSTTIHLPSGLIVQKIDTYLGASVDTGEPIIVFDAESLLNELERYHLEYETLQHNLVEAADFSNLQTSLFVAKSQVEELHRQIAYYEDEYNRNHLRYSQTYNDAVMEYEAVLKHYECYDDKSIRDLIELRTRMLKLQHEINKLQSEYEYLQWEQSQSGSDLEYATPSTTNTAYDVEKAYLYNEIHDKKDEYQKLQYLFDKISNDNLVVQEAKSKVENAKSALDSAEETLLELQYRYENDRYSREYQLKMEDIQYQSVSREIENKKRSTDMQIKLLTNQIESQKESIFILEEIKKNKYTLNAPHKGVVMHLDLEELQTTSNSNYVRLSNKSTNKYRAVWKMHINEYANLKVGTVVQIVNRGSTIMSEINSIGSTDRDGMREVSALVDDIDGIVEGESVEIVVEISNISYDFVVPNESVRQDANGYFVYRIAIKDGFWGEEYQAERAYIEVQQRGNSMTAITGPVTPDSMIIVSSERQLIGGDRIRFY